MIIINEKWAVKLDDPKYNWMIYRYEDERQMEKRDGTIEKIPADYYSLGLYYGSLPAALRGIIKQETMDIYTSGNVNIDDIASEIDKVATDIYENTLKYLQSEAGAGVSTKR